MKPLKLLFSVIAILLLLITVAIAGFVATFDANQYKNKIHQLVKEKTGRELQLQGDIQLSIFPNIALDLGAATFSNTPQFGNTPFATVKSARIGVQLMPLLKKRLLIEKIVLNDLQLDLHKKANGESNWDSFSANSSHQDNKTSFFDDFLKNFSVAGMDLNNANIHWRDESKQQDLRLSPLYISTGAFHPNQPIDVVIKGSLQQKHPPLQLSGELSSTLTLTKNNQYFTLKGTQLKTTASGLPIAQLELTGDIEGTIKKIHILNLKLDLTANKSALAKGSLQLNLAGDTHVDIEQQSVQIPAMQLKTTLTDLPHAGVVIKTTVMGNTQVNLKKKQLHIAKMKLNADTQHLIASGSHASTQVLGTTQFNWNTRLLTIQAMQLSSNASKIIENSGMLSAHLKGNLRANLHDLLIDLNGMHLVVEAKDAPQIGHINFDMAGDFNADIQRQQFGLKQAKIDSNMKGGLLEKGSLSTQLSSANIIANSKTQQIRLVGMKLHSIGKQLPHIGQTDTHITGTLNAKIKQRLFAMQNARIKTTLSGEIVSGGNLDAQLSSTSLIANTNNQQFKLKGMQLNATLKGGLVPAGKLTHSSKGNIDIDLKHKKGHAQLNNIVFAIAGAKLTGSAKLSQLSPQPTMTGTFKTNRFNLKQLLTSLGIKVPPTSNPKAFGQSQASFQLTATPNNANLRHLSLRLDQSKITGDLLIKQFNPIAIQTQLAINQLTVDDYLAPANANITNKNTSNDKLLPVEMLKTLDLRGIIDLKKLTFDQLKLTQVHASINAKKGIINLQPLRFNLFKGKYNGKLILNVVSNNPVIKMSHEIQRVRAENLLLQFFQDRYISGNIFLSTDLTTRGNSIATLKQNLNGTAKLQFHKGTLRDSKLAQKVSLAIAAFEKSKTAASGETNVTFTQLGANWKINRGVFSSDNMQLLAPHFIIKGTGNANIVNNQLNLKLQLGTKDKNNKLFAPLHIYGSVEHLNYQLELDVLLKALLKQQLEKKTAQLKQKLLDQKEKTLQKLEQRKQTELEKLRTRTEAAQQRLKAQQEKLRQRLQEQQLKIQEKLKNTASEELNHKLKKNIEEEVGDKLKDTFKGLF